MAATTSSPQTVESFVTRIHAHGLDEAAEQLAPFICVRYVQLERGMACSSGEFAESESMALGHLSSNRHKVEWLDVPRGRVLMVVPIQGRARVGTLGIGPGHIMLVSGPTQLVSCTERQYASWFVSIPDRSARQGDSIAAGVRIRFLRASVANIEIFDRYARGMIDGVAGGPSAGALSDICNGWLRQTREKEVALAAPAARCQAAVRARQYIDEHLELPMTLASVCQASYSSPRALEYGFREIFGVSPITYIRCARLSRVRRELYSSQYTSGRITQLALQWGFWHLSQFSKDYFDLFGELPSMTLARATGRARSHDCDCLTGASRIAVAEQL